MPFDQSRLLTLQVLRDDLSATQSRALLDWCMARGADTFTVNVVGCQPEIEQYGDLLEQAISIAKAAEACAESGNAAKGIEIALDLEQLIYEVNTLLNAASMINRIGKTDSFSNFG
jgi:hypothetical protein